MRLLMCLARRAGTNVSVEELLKDAWAGVVVTPDSVYQSITSLRRLLGDDPKRPQYIVNAPRLGYRLIATVTPWPESMETSANLSVESQHLAQTPAVSGLPAAHRRKWATRLGIGAAAFVVIGAVYFAQHKLASRSQETVAVLPFLDLTTQEMNEEFFADGLTEELIGDLSKYPGLRISPPTSSFHFKGKNPTVADVARQLGVRYVIDGSVRKSGNVYRVAARLVRVEGGYVVWSDTYDRPLGDLVKVQKDIAAEATKEIRASIMGGPKSEASRPAT
jgi:transcriptional activator of cad operon